MSVNRAKNFRLYTHSLAVTKSADRASRYRWFRPGIDIETALVFGFAGSVGAMLLGADQPLMTAWLTVVGPSKIVAMALFCSLGIWLLRALRDCTPPGIAVALVALGMQPMVPVEYWAITLLCIAPWSATQRPVTLPVLLSLGVLGLHIAMVADRLPQLITISMLIDKTLVAVLVEFSGRSVTIHDSVIVVEQGISLRLINPCTSIWPILSVAGAVCCGLGVMGMDKTRNTCAMLALAVITVISLNIIRLTAMSRSVGTYEWLHDGSGGVIFRLLILTTIILVLALEALRRP